MAAEGDGRQLRNVRDQAKTLELNCSGALKQVGDFDKSFSTKIAIDRRSNLVRNLTKVKDRKRVSSGIRIAPVGSYQSLGTSPPRPYLKFAVDPPAGSGQDSY